MGKTDQIHGKLPLVFLTIRVLNFNFQLQIKYMMGHGHGFWTFCGPHPYVGGRHILSRTACDSHVL